VVRIIHSLIRHSFDHSEPKQEEEMNQKTQLYCVWLAPIGLALLAVGFFPIARYFPVPPPSDSATAIARFYQAHTTATRLGLLVAFVGLAAYGPFVAVLTRQMLRINRRATPWRCCR